MSKEYTIDEVRDNFINKVITLVNYWSKESRATNTHDKLKGLTHSLLATLDGEASDMPAFVVIPSPCGDDREYNESIGENYYKEMCNCDNCNISGSLHELFMSKFDSSTLTYEYGQTNVRYDKSIDTEPSEDCEVAGIKEEN